MNRSTFSVPVEDRYFEDYEPGTVHEFGTIAVEETEIIEFGQRFDPQVFHTDPQAAKQTSLRRFNRQRMANGQFDDALVCRSLPVRNCKPRLTGC